MSEAAMQKMLELQQQTADQVAEMRALMGVQKASKARRRRRGPVAYSPPTQLPGPKATDISTARARKILREYGWR